MGTVVSKIVNNCHRDLCYIWDDVDATLYIFPGPHWQGLSGCECLEAGETKKLEYSEVKD